MTNNNFESLLSLVVPLGWARIVVRYSLHHDSVNILQTNLKVKGSGTLRFYILQGRYIDQKTPSVVPLLFLCGLPLLSEQSRTSLRYIRPGLNYGIQRLVFQL